ncbi:MAG: glycosyltransferase family 2 protein [Acidobacteria bacterium]|nr:MAG: glycosyltransferase family 2 protein [Acidobacteriota bacterium]
MMPRLSIVIVSFNARAHLVNCLESLRAAPPATSHAIVVVDNASTDGSADAAREFPSVRVIAMARNAGFAAANNAGIRGSSGDLVLLLNSDTIVPPRAIDRLVDRLLIDTAVGIAGPRLVDADGRVELSFGPMISPLNEARQKMIGRLYDARVGPLVRRVERETRREQFVDWVSGACLLVRRSAAESAGLLDERFFLYTEDVDFCHAVRALGYRVLFTPSAEIVHLRGRSRATAPEAVNAAYRRSQIAFYEKHHPRWARLLKLYLCVRGKVDGCR